MFVCVCAKAGSVQSDDSVRTHSAYTICTLDLFMFVSVICGVCFLINQ